MENAKHLNKPLEDVKVLVVDDTEDARKLLVLILKRHGASVTSCTSVVEAITELEKQKFDVVVSDIAMPGLDGYDLVQALREMEIDANHPTPVVAVSGHADFDSKKKCHNQGFQVHLSKPINQSHLVAVLERLKELDGEAVRQGFSW